MEQRALGRSGLTVSALGLGTMNFGADWHGVGALGLKQAGRLVDAALDRGVTLIDTADIYGRGASERMLGRILGKRRGRVVLATKVLGRMKPDDPSSGGLSRRHIGQALEDSLKRLRTDWIDLYMPHHVDPEVPAEESYEAFDRAARAGKVRVLGVSNFGAAQLGQWLDRAEGRGWRRLEFNQVQLSLGARFAEGDALPACRARGMSLVAWSPLGGGLLSGKYAAAARPEGRRRRPAEAFPRLPEARLEPVVALLTRVAALEGVTPAQAALAWVLGKPGVAAALVGARHERQLEESLGAKPLSARAAELLDRASALALAGT